MSLAASCCLVLPRAAYHLSTTKYPPPTTTPTPHVVLFSGEIAIKIGAEGTKPWRFAMGPDAAWNLFDTAIVVLSLPIPALQLDGMMALRLVRLLRIKKLLKSKTLSMILEGLFTALTSASYILILMGLVSQYFRI